MRFIADVMVGKLARWLRVLGFDVLYSNRYDDDEIIRLAEAEDRTILTRDTGFSARRISAPLLFIKDDNYHDQMRQVIRAFDLKDFQVFTRCLHCNTPLEAADKETVFEKIPPYVYLTQDRFARCPDCNRIYWHGTHAEEMEKRAKKWLT